MAKFKIWSNLFFLFPLALAIYFKIWPTTGFLTAVIIASSAYHSAGEARWLAADEIFSWLLILSNLYLCYLGNFKFPYFYLGLLCVGFAVYFQQGPPTDKNYNLRHGLWHLFSAIITIFSLLTYLYR